MKSKLIGTVGVLVVLMLFYRHGRSIYKPIIMKIEGKKSVASVVKKVELVVLDRLKPYLLKNNLTKLPDHLLLLGLKEEQVLEVYFKNDDTFQLLKTYPFTAFSGELGPKLKEGDRQIPEGIYKVEYLNPNSAYYLSMKISYPNEYDISKSEFVEQSKMGNDIFIHGKAATIGCIPIGDEAMEELFLLVSHVLHQSVKVIISPRDFRKGKSNPEIAAIDWEDELYETIREELKTLQNY